MKKITFLIALLTISFGFSQEMLINGDFESPQNPAVWYGNAFNVVNEGGNNFNSANVTTAGDAFAVNLSQKGLNITAGLTYELKFDGFSDGNRTMVVGIGLSADPWTNTTQIVNLTNSSQPFSLKFVANFTNADSRVIFDMGADTGFVGIDNVSLKEVPAACDDGLQNGDETGVDCGGSSCNACMAPAPTDAPTAPPARDAGDVISIYGDAYGTEIGLNNVDWDQGSTSTEESHGGNDVLKLDFQTFLGLDLGSEVDASSMTHVHIDFWIADDFAGGQVFLPKWSNHNGGGETDAFEYTYAVGAEDSQKWLSIDTTIDAWNNVLGAGPGARANLKQLVIGVSATLDLVYVDNIYFYKDSGNGGGGGNDPATPPASVSFNNMGDYSSVFSGLGSATGLVPSAFANATEETINIGGVDVKKIVITTPGGGAQFAFAPIDLTASGLDLDSFFFDYYFDGSESAGKQIRVAVQGGGIDYFYNIDLSGSGRTTGWNRVNVPFASLMGAGGTLNAVSQVQFVGQGGADPFGSLYVTNVMFIKAGTASVDDNSLVESTVLGNPTDSEWTIRTPNSTIKNVQVFNILGKRVYSNASVNKNEVGIPAHNLRSGIYIARIQTDNGTKSIKLLRN